MTWQYATRRSPHRGKPQEASERCRQLERFLGRNVDEAVVGGGDDERLGAGEPRDQLAERGIDLAELLERFGAFRAVAVRHHVVDRPVRIHELAGVGRLHRRLDGRDQLVERLVGDALRAAAMADVVLGIDDVLVRDDEGRVGQRFENRRSQT